MASHPIKQVKRNSILSVAERTDFSNRTLLVQGWRITIRKIVLAAVLDFGLVSASWVAEIADIRKRVNGAQAPAYQIQSVSVPSVVQEETSRIARTNQHEQAIIAHEAMNNGSAGAYQKMAEDHQKMMRGIAVNDTRPSVLPAVMNEHERAVVVHETMNNDQSGVHQVTIETCRRMINAGRASLQYERCHLFPGRYSLNRMCHCILAPEWGLFYPSQLQSSYTNLNKD